MPKSLWAAATALCLLAASPLLASSATPEQLAAADAEFKKAVGEIKAKQYQAGIDRLMTIYNGTGADADALNQLGYAHRKLGHFDQSLRYYKEALELDPGHIQVHEYLGELYLMTKKPDLAKKELATLSKLCGTCAEQKELAEAIAKVEADPTAVNNPATFY